MRTVVAGLTAALLVVAIAAPAAAQGKPDRSPYQPEVIEFPDNCPFPVLLEDDFAKGQILTFPEDRHGDTRVLTAGVFKGTLTNQETGETLDYTLGGTVTFVFHADGSQTVRGGGNLLVWYNAAEAEASALGQGIFLVSGRIVDRYNAEGELVESTARGRIVDVCEELAP